MKENNNSTFEAIIKLHLDEVAAGDPDFKEKYENSDKSIRECCSYIINQVRLQNVQVMGNAEVYALAAKYYDEDVKVEKATPCRVVCSVDDLSEFEKTAAREAARKEYQDQCLKGIREKYGEVKKQKAPAKPEAEEQPTLF